MASLVPGIALVVRGPTRLHGSYLVLALVFAVSWASDSFSWLLDGSWAPMYVAVPIQIALLLAVFTEHRVVALLGVGVLAGFSLISFPGPEVLTTAVGSAAVVCLARGRISLPVYLYFGVGTLFYLLMVSGDFMQYWYWYQACRIGAFAVFTALVAGGPHVGVHH